MNSRECVQSIIGKRSLTPRASGTGRAPANIALCKYWGKRDTELNLPVTASLSISLGHLGTVTGIEPAEGGDRYVLNGLEMPEDTPFARRMRAYLDLFRPEPGAGYRVITHNTIPTAAGLASSASGFAALAAALDDLYNLGLDDAQRSILARLGSGSASRSIAHGFMEWRAGTRDDGMDSYAVPCGKPWDGLMIGLVRITTEEKKTSSRDAMKRTVDTSVLYRAWPVQVERDMMTLREAIDRQDFTTLGQTAENNALAMHATGLGAWPPVLFWWPESVRAMQQVWQLREEGVPVYLTMDAGPNVKLIAQRTDLDAINDTFRDVEWVDPFDGARQL